MSTISQLDRRIVEAELLGRMYAETANLLGRDAALDLIRNVQEKAAFEAGQAFAESAPHGPGLEHFLGVLDLWRDSGAVDIGPVQIGPGLAHFEITRCGYIQAYRDMGLPGELIPLLSCARDEPFAQGYSKQLRLERPQTLESGYPACGFTFHWDNE
ncbi:MAG: L-2-amino-thiazoline-4-carboxylic acid hydrolase [Desulfovibrionaceae bacterium]